ncbi:acyl-CoA N-acyltransferase [Xylona heveae TC161]|uniref:Acyl-CoA N-acyltransferase n=1 Tax=Xylona heveae (strain CBS 132557 / TC161) TaxID=1328760 RepID=A0A165JWN8_XYLHT|nr:acyl-CoA N-acyltransferase [Xylona heveae TC161]KZF26717.1 acyl-CoA N-acyltransferase [Xylona heveae TC161]
MAAIEVTPITEQDIPGAIDAVQQGFADDPYNHWIFDRSKFSAERNRASLGLRCKWGMRNALFFVAKEAGSDTVLGVAMWMRPKPLTSAAAQSSWTDWFESWRLWLDQVFMNLWYGRGGLNVKRYYIWKSSQSLIQHKLWTNPGGYYFCNIVSVLPAAQGRGVGKLLFKTVTDMADREGVPCYLESSKDEPNVRIYEKLGFRLAGNLDCDDDGVVCKLFAMIRDPQVPQDLQGPQGPQPDNSTTAVLDHPSVCN